MFYFLFLCAFVGILFSLGDQKRQLFLAFVCLSVSFTCKLSAEDLNHFDERLWCLSPTCYSPYPPLPTSPLFHHLFCLRLPFLSPPTRLLLLPPPKPPPSLTTTQPTSSYHHPTRLLLLPSPNPPPLTATQPPASYHHPTHLLLLLPVRGGWLHSLNQKLVNFSGRTLGFVDSVHIFSISFKKKLFFNHKS